MKTRTYFAEKLKMAQTPEQKNELFMELVKRLALLEQRVEAIDKRQAAKLL